MRSLWLTISAQIKAISQKVARIQANVLLTLVYFTFITPVAIWQKAAQKHAKLTSWIAVYPTEVTLEQLRKQA